MTDIVKVTPERLKSTAASLNQTGASIKKTTSQMLALMTGISQSVWSGEASSAYLGKFSGLQSDITKMCKMIEDQVLHLNTIASEYQTTEAQRKAAAATLKNNVIA